MLLPWHAPAWERTQALLRADRLPHALLLQGPDGMGKGRYAVLLARAVLCHAATSQGLPCGTCGSCTLTRAGTHPDLRICELEIDRKKDREKATIGIDQVRTIVEYLALKSHYGGYKVMIIRTADKLTPHAANALLKTLEEPPPESLLILVSARPAALPATLLSRCQRLLFASGDTESTGQWLKARLEARAEPGAGSRKSGSKKPESGPGRGAQGAPSGPEYDPELLLSLAGGAPFAALELAAQGDPGRRQSMLKDFHAIAQGRADPLAIAEAWLKFGLKASLYWLYSWLVDMARLKATDEPPFLSNPDLRGVLAAIASSQDTQRLHVQIGRISEALRAAEGHMNPQLLLEEALTAWALSNVQK